MGTFKIVVIGVALLSTIGALPNPIRTLNAGKDAAHSLFNDQDLVGSKTKTNDAIVGESSGFIAETAITKVPTPMVTSSCMPTEQNSISGHKENYLASLERTIDLILTESLAIRIDDETDTACATVLGFEAIAETPVTESLQESSIDVHPTASLAILNDCKIKECTTSFALPESTIDTAITESLQERILQVIPTVLLAKCIDCKTNTSCTAFLGLGESIFDAAITETLRKCTINILPAVPLANSTDLKINATCITVLELPRSIVDTASTETVQEPILQVILTLPQPNRNGFETKAPCTTDLPLPNSIVRTTSTKALQACALSTSPTGSLVTVNTDIAKPSQEHTFKAVPTGSLLAGNSATIEALQESTIHDIFTLPPADCEGSKADATCTVMLVLPESIAKIAITKALQERILATIPTKSLAIVNTATTEALQEAIIRDIFTLSLADCDSSQANTSGTTVFVLPKSNVNTAATKALLERTFTAISTGSLATVNTSIPESLQDGTIHVILALPLAGYDSSKAHAPHTTVLPEFIVKTATTKTLQDSTLESIPTGSLDIVNTATTKPLQEGKLNIIPTVSLANRDLKISLWENSGNVLLIENRSPSENRSPVYGRITFAVVGYIAFFTIAGMMVTRLKTLRRGDWRSMTLITILSTLMYTVGIFFIVSAALLMDGMDLPNEGLCRAAVYLCLVFYLGCKVIMYVFLVERAHMLRHVRRGRDYVFLAGIAILVIGFGPIAFLAFKKPVTGISKVDGQCRIGLPSRVTISLLSYDIAINVAMVGMYVFLAWPYMRGRGTPGIWLRALGLRKSMCALSQGILLELLIWRGCFGACFVVVPTVANVAILFKIHGREQGWLCVTICTIDVTWSVIIIHWLTAKPEGLEEAPPGTYVQME